MRRALFFVILGGILLGSSVAQAEWTDQKVQALTERLQKYKSSWTVQRTVRLLQRAQTSAMDVSVLIDDSGSKHKLTVFNGEIVMVDGEDVSENLARKITHGDNSPIIEDVHDSQITTG